MGLTQSVVRFKRRKFSLASSRREAGKIHSVQRTLCVASLKKKKLVRKNEGSP